MVISAFIGLIGLGPASRVFTCSLLDRLLTATTYISICPHITPYSNIVQAMHILLLTLIYQHYAKVLQLDSTWESAQLPTTHRGSHACIIRERVCGRFERGLICKHIWWQNTSCLSVLVFRGPTILVWTLRYFWIACSLARPITISQAPARCRLLYHLSYDSPSPRSDVFGFPNTQ